MAFVCHCSFWRLLYIIIIIICHRKLRSLPRTFIYIYTYHVCGLISETYYRKMPTGLVYVYRVGNVILPCGSCGLGNPEFSSTSCTYICMICAERGGIVTVRRWEVERVLVINLSFNAPKFYGRRWTIHITHTHINIIYTYIYIIIYVFFPLHARSPRNKMVSFVLKDM